MTVMERVAGVLRLQPRVFEDIEADGGANGQALGIVVLSSLAAGVGGGFIGGPGGMVAEALGAVVGWVMWAGVTYVLGARLLPERDTRTDMGELLRVMGYSSAPTLVHRLRPVPILGRAVPIIVSFWLLGHHGPGRAAGARLPEHAARVRRGHHRLAALRRHPRRRRALAAPGLTPPAGHGRQRAVSRHPVISPILATVTSSTRSRRAASSAAGANTTTTADTVLVVTIVRAESDVGLPNGPTRSASVRRPPTCTSSLRMPG